MVSVCDGRGEGRRRAFAMQTKETFAMQRPVRTLILVLALFALGSSNAWSTIQPRLLETKSLISQTTKLTAGTADQFGFSVAASGNTMVVGAPQDDHAGAHAGAAYIFERHLGGPDNWGLVKKITAADAGANHSFGWSVGIHGDTVSVGACSANAAYVFDRNFGGADNWGQVKKVTGGTGFGTSVALSGNTLAVGAPDDGGNGAAYIFDRDLGGADNWGQVIRVTAPSTGRFGQSVGIDADTVVVGATLDFSLGAAYVFDRDSGGTDNWGQVKKITASDATANDQFGAAAGVSGDTIVVGATVNDSLKGAAYVYYRDSGGDDNWGEVKKITAADASAGDNFGYSASISGDTIAVGAHGDDDDGSNSGSAYVFKRNIGGPDSWGEMQKITAADASAGDIFGYPVSISGNTIALGAPYADTYNGAAYLFEIPPEADLVVSKSDSVTSAVPGGNLTYTIIASNNGPDDEPTASLADAFPAGLSCTWTSTTAGGATGNTTTGGGNLAETLAMPADSSVTYTADCAIDPAATGTLSGTATIIGSVTDPLPGDNSATDSDTVLTPETDLAVTKTDGVTSAIPGSTVSYTITASNAGPSHAVGATVADTFAADLSGCDWTCVAAGSATCTANGSGDINDAVNIPVGDSVTYTATCTIAATAGGTLSNTATVTADLSANDPNAGNDSASDNDTALIAAVFFDAVTHAAEDETVDVPVQLATAGNALGAVTFSIDYDASCLDPDIDQDGTLDSVTVNVPADFTVTIFYDALDTDGEIDVSIADFNPPIASLPNGDLLTINYAVTCPAVPVTAVDAIQAFSLDPAATFGNDAGGDVNGAQVDGIVRIWPGPRGDCSGNDTLGAGDLTAISLELFDGDGDNWFDAAQPTFAGSPVGCDANASGVIAAGDVTCINQLIFGLDCGGVADLGGTSGKPEILISTVLEGGMTWIRALLTPNGHELGSVAFSLDLDPQGLSAVDINADGVPDNLRFPNGQVSLTRVQFDAEDTDGELDILLADFTGSALRDGVLVEVGIPVPTLSGLRLSGAPTPSFGTVTGGDVDGRVTVAGDLLFVNGFESGDMGAWSGAF
jgi:uncharacterized repeat protein (TIGR01451 family)